MDTQGTLDALLKRNREFELSAGPGANNHIPMVLIALFRMGASPDLMIRYVDSFDLHQSSRRTDKIETATLTRENWRDHLGIAGFAGYVEFFDRWTSESSLAAVLRESVPILMKGVCTEAYHALLRLGYALDYGSREEAVSALSYWASMFYTGPEFDVDSDPVEPESFFAQILERASKLEIEPVHSIDGRLMQVYGSPSIAMQWKPIRFPTGDPLEKISILIRELFQQNPHFTLLHGLTSCQSLRRVLPYLKNPQEELSRYWHSVCAAFLTVEHSEFETGRGTIAFDGTAWDELFVRALSSKEAMEHRVKLVYSCWLEFQRSNQEEYRALASREIRHASPFA